MPADILCCSGGREGAFCRCWDLSLPESLRAPPLPLLARLSLLHPPPPAPLPVPLAPLPLLALISAIKASLCSLLLVLRETIRNVATPVSSTTQTTTAAPAPALSLPRSGASTAPPPIAAHEGPNCSSASPVTAS